MSTLSDHKAITMQRQMRGPFMVRKLNQEDYSTDLYIFPAGVVPTRICYAERVHGTIHCTSAEDAISKMGRLERFQSPILQVVSTPMPTMILPPDEMHEIDIGGGQIVLFPVLPEPVPRVPEHDMERRYVCSAFLETGCEIEFVVTFLFNHATPTELFVKIFFSSIYVPNTWSLEETNAQTRRWGDLVMEAIRTEAMELLLPSPPRMETFEAPVGIGIPRNIFEMAYFSIQEVPPYMYDILLEELHRRIVRRGPSPICSEKFNHFYHKAAEYNFKDTVDLLFTVLQNPRCNPRLAEEILQKYVDVDLTRHQPRSPFTKLRLQIMSRMIQVPAILLV